MTEGKPKMAIRQNFRGRGLRVLLVLLVLVPVVVFMTLVLQKTRDLKGLRDSEASSRIKTPSKAGLCVLKRDCPEDSFSFFIRTGAANVIAPRICLQNQLVLGVVLNNAGRGINIVLINGTTGGVLKTGHFDMYGGDVDPLLEFLKSMEAGSVVLMASYDDPSTRLTQEARQLIAELGSSAVKSLGFRDNWVFVGGKGASASSFEKLLKNNNNNKYENWPELIEIQGCIPRYLG
ncbi:protein FAM3C-like isoform X2 [Cyclopterus lumpus]|uniref:protein FAM3C-like isoform X2 n=1 Tax=Cyclopterus lumpus TaxID=8103 RepID=UPI001485E737|nr:protein FAM3C-like isoform X2 [Cyclopterus lumpus]